MKYQKQKYRHNPPETYGDCHRTAIACILDLDLNEVPHWSEMFWEDTKAWAIAEEAWLRSRGYASVKLVYKCNLEELMTYMGWANPGIIYLLGGTSKNGTGHTVVCRGGEIIHDPAQDDAGIVGPMSDEYFWITFFTPIQFVYDDKKDGH